MGTFEWQTADMLKSGHNRGCLSAIPEVRTHCRGITSTKAPIVWQQVNTVKMVWEVANSCNEPTVNPLSSSTRDARFPAPWSDPEQGRQQRKPCPRGSGGDSLPVVLRKFGCRIRNEHEKTKGCVHKHAKKHDFAAGAKSGRQ